MVLVERINKTFTYRVTCAILISKTTGGGQYATNEPESKVDFRQSAKGTIIETFAISNGAGQGSATGQHFIAILGRHTNHQHRGTG